MCELTSQKAAAKIITGVEFKTLVAILTAELYCAAHEPATDEDPEKSDHDA